MKWENSCYNLFTRAPILYSYGGYLHQGSDRFWNLLWLTRAADLNCKKKAVLRDISNILVFANTRVHYQSISMLLNIRYEIFSFERVFILIYVFDGDAVLSVTRHRYSFLHRFRFFFHGTNYKQSVETLFKLYQRGFVSHIRPFWTEFSSIKNS